MPNCCVIGCELKKTQSQSTLTMHRLPRSEDKKKKWLKAIGMENIKQGVKDVFICSQHFDDNAFNRNLAVVRLRDDAIPSGPPMQHFKQVNSPVPEFESTEDSTYLLLEHSDSSPDVDENADLPASQFPIQSKRIRKMKQLEHICQEQRKKIKRLNQVIRRQNKKITDFRNIIKDLLESNLLESESSFVLEENDKTNNLHQKTITRS